VQGRNDAKWHNRRPRRGNPGFQEVHQLEPDWPTFLDDFYKHWPTDAEHTYVDFLKPNMLPGEYHVARVEGWILGVM
jgi:hypothetical protein